MNALNKSKRSDDTPAILEIFHIFLRFESAPALNSGTIYRFWMGNKKQAKTAINFEYSACKHNSSHTVVLVLSAAVLVLVLDTIADYEYVYEYEYDTRPDLNIASCCQ
jgi:hypothetical protein